MQDGAQEQKARILLSNSSELLRGRGQSAAYGSRVASAGSGEDTAAGVELEDTSRAEDNLLDDSQ